MPAIHHISKHHRLALVRNEKGDLIIPPFEPKEEKTSCEKPKSSILSNLMSRHFLAD